MMGNIIKLYQNLSNLAKIAPEGSDFFFGDQLNQPRLGPFLRTDQLNLPRLDRSRVNSVSRNPGGNPLVKKSQISLLYAI